MHQPHPLLLSLVFVFVFAVFTNAQLTPSYDWQVIETEHFRIIYHPEVAGLAAETLVAVEDAYVRWSQELATTPPAKTDIVIIDFDDSPNGFADLDNLTSWEFASQTQFGVFFGGRVPSNIGDTVYHEYWHIADINHVNGLSQTLRNVFGRIILPNRIKPWFAIEGSATYSEDLVYGYSRASAALSSMALRQLALDNNFPDLARAAHRFSNSSWPTSGTLAYVMGAWFLRYIEETYGRGTVGAFDHLNADDWLSTLSQLLNVLVADRFGLSFYVGPDFGSIMAKATGVSMDELYQGFQQWMRSQALAQLDRVSSEGGATVSLKLTDYGYNTAQPKWSPDGQWIAYEHSDPFRRGGIRLVHPDGSDDHALTSAVLIFDHSFSWSPDSRKIVYASYDQHGAYENVGDLFIYDLETEKNQRLTFGMRAFSPVFSLDGQSVLFAKNQGGDLSPQLLKMDLANGALEVVHEFGQDTFLDFFSLSPDGAHIVMTLWKRPGYTDLYLLDLSDHSLTPITQDQEEDFRPTWSPDGQYVVFDSIRDETFNLHAYRLSDGQMFRITNVVEGAFSPTVSPDGQHVAFTGYSGAGFDLHLMPFDPSSWKQVNYPQQTLPAWEGFPTLDVPVQPYNPYVTMLPKYWVPIIRDTQAGISTDAWDALYRQYYALEGGWDWESQLPFGTLFYQNEEHLSPISVSFLTTVIPGAGDYESVSFEFSPVSQFFVQHDLNLSLERADFGGETHTISGGWDYFRRFGKGLSWLDVSISLNGAFTHAMEGNAWSTEVVLDVRKTLHLPVVDVRGPHTLASKMTLGWSDIEGAFSPGGVRGTFMLRGQPRWTLFGSYVAVSSLEYRFPVVSIEKGLGLGPLFIDDVRALTFVDAGTAAESADVGALLDGILLSYGAELSLSLTTGYFSRRTLNVGVAYGQGQAAPELYFSLRGSF